jgi:hypothetical protein
MKDNRVRWARYGLHAAILALVAYLVLGAAASQRGAATARAAVGDTVVRISGPYAHDNLAVYLIHSRAQDPRSFITLSEGLKSKQVEVTEQENAQVRELMIENKSDQYLFLQEGDTLKGGQQDRTIYAGHIVPPHSGKQGLPAFCVEPNRWVAGAQGAKFDLPANAALAPKEVRQAAKYQADQGAVWAQVAVQRQLVTSNFASTLSAGGSSLNEATEQSQVRNVAQEFNDKLAYALDLHADAVGVAIAVNGQIEEVNIYPNHALLRKQFERLVGSYAVQAAVKKKEAQKGPALSATDVAYWMHDESSRRAAQAEVARLDHARRIIAITNGVPNQQDAAIQILEQGIDRMQPAPTALFRPAPARNAAVGLRMAPQVPVAASTTRNIINAANVFDVQPLEGKDKSVTYFEKKAVHVQYMSRVAPPAQPGQAEGQGGGVPTQRHQPSIQQELRQIEQRQQQLQRIINDVQVQPVPQQAPNAPRQ